MTTRTAYRTCPLCEATCGLTLTIGRDRTTGGDSEVSEEVLGLFAEQAALWSNLLDPRIEGWRDAVHTLRGAASGIGADDLAAQCAAAEALLPEEERLPTAALLGALGFGLMYDTIHHWSEFASHAVPAAEGLVAWAVTAFFDGLFGLAGLWIYG